ncbi:PREDICTED: spermatogenesis- and oogenesis-specific basic helix-loop-helix-containing protein 1 [Propithecus coquereli]|uniref:spermatogenesis- and oogenesis-specific basic helix-loop-helix-containing protein 1 n=1 Tax=Propithecus coquereli TaxID=379532 RepID=UPI00063FAC07|nr:PREDICTED: spermatogenesis- and oogenesis-specific basic helix-loop-helix-containing protein 1 [Propithecus coquereli]
MASQDPEPDAGVPRVLASGGCSASSLSCHEDLAPGSGPATAPPVAEGPSPGLPRNVLSERERRKRISMSCERLRALLPRFAGRREDMASVLEMTVQFIRLARTLVPGWEQHAESWERRDLVVAPSKEAWHSLRKNVLQLALSRQVPADTPGPGTGAQGDPPRCAALGVAESKALTGSSEELDGPPLIPEPSSLAPQPAGLTEVQGPPSPWPRCSRELTSPVMSEEAPSWLGHSEPLARAATPPGGPAEEALVPAPDTRSVSGSDGEDRMAFLLTASPDWWPGSLEGRGCGAPTLATARSSPLDEAEPGLLEDPESGCQELQDGSLEPWGSDLGCSDLALRDEEDSIFPDFFAS